jgi:hypothetical protein
MLVWLLWAVAIIAFVGGIEGVIKSATFPRALAKHPVRAEATITQAYINGLGGDPGFDYEYRVGGRMFSGSAGGSHQTGETVPIEYAATEPSQSCSCNAAHDAPGSVASAIWLAGFLTLPLVGMLLWRVPPRIRTRHDWFVPVHGLGEWVGFLGGVVVALAFGAFALAYVFAFAVER